MAETKRKSRDNPNGKKSKKQKTLATQRDNKRKRRGPRLPSKFRKELDRLNPSGAGRSPSGSDAEERIDSDEGEVYAGNDVYEYEEGVTEEESKKNRRFDQVENLEYEMPEDFEDENVSSDDENEDDNAGEDSSGEEEHGDGRHSRMLQEITGMPGEAFEGKKKKNNNVITEAYPESEYNPSRDVLDGHGQISIEDLLDPLHGTSGYSMLRKRVHQMERKSGPTPTPLPKVERKRLDRKAAYQHSNKDALKWVPLIKRNREAGTIIFDNDVDLGFSTVGAIASEFEPRTEFEKKMASLVYDEKVMDAHKKDGARLLELNEVSVEDERDRQNRIAKMRSLLFRHEMKAKHIKKIKSKTFHRLLKKDRLKAASSENQIDPEAAKELARKHEFERAKERITLRHKSGSKWAKRIKERGLKAQDEGTRAAIAEQQHQHSLLTRKMNSMNDTSSSEESSDGDESDGYSSGEQDRTSRLLEEAKEKTLKVINEEDEVPNSGLLSLPFMVRGMKKRDEAAAEEAKLALEDFESLSKQLDGSSRGENTKVGPSSGRMVFNAAGTQAQKSSKTKSDDRTKADRFYDDSDGENDIEAEDNNDDEDICFHKHEVSFFSPCGSQSFDDIAKDPGPKTTDEVAIFASGAWKKVKAENNRVKGGNNNADKKKSPVALESVSKNEDLQETEKDLGEDSDSDSEGQMVDGILSSGPKASYELPSQAELIHQAFAADNVEDDFEKHKQEILNEENPEPEKPVLLPGWGQWTHVQQKKGLPSWMVKEHDTAKKKREEALKKRKDAQLKHVIISEKLDKRAEKLYTKTLPFPYTSKEVFEQSIRMPIGPEFNPATAVGALNRPEVMKKPGQIIKPIEFEEVDPHKKTEQLKHVGQKQKQKQKQKPKQKQKKNKSTS
ncbi:uncharacterized protein C57A7.06 [Morus notabilis]|uniref:uncharacterized protein C57A7.06 n=1 Tax=Morus notabilis TaxID=981085 RepID=UPI000CED1A72|nr:uncharacterized protein C57A7.06 [Morus notabilis]